MDKSIEITITDSNWGDTNFDQLRGFFEKSTHHYSEILGENPGKPIVIKRSQDQRPSFDYPMTVFKDANVDIYLATDSNKQSQFIYQWGHELLHYFIKREYRPFNDKFAWFEEALCEMSSLYILKNYRLINDQNDRKYKYVKFWNKAHLEYYSNIIFKSKEIGSKHKLSKFIKANLELLEIDRMKRITNRVVAIEILRLFERKPILWKSLQYLNAIEYSDKMSFEEYVVEWSEKLPKKYSKDFVMLKRLLLY